MISSDKALADAADAMRENAVHADGSLEGCFRAIDKSRIDRMMEIWGGENGTVE